MKCTFFGHRDTPQSTERKLRQVLIELIEENGVTEFFVGNNGNFDKIVVSVLSDLKKNYPKIKYTVVLAYLNSYSEHETVYPEGLEHVPPKYAIDKRNRWMIEQSDIAVTYVTHNWGGAYKFKKIADRKCSKVINLL